MTVPWNGLPDQPERSGHHIVTCGDGDRYEFWWDASLRSWTRPSGAWSVDEMAAEYQYAGAVYSRSQLAQILERSKRKTDDTCRLDFMEHTQIDAMKANGQWEILSMSGDTAETIGTGDTMRAAIDAAMNAENRDV